MKASGANSGGAGQGDAPSATAAVGPGSAAERFAESFNRLRSVVHDACALHAEWEARVVAGIKAALDFVAADSVAANAVFARPRGEAAGDSGPQDEVIAYFTELLDAVVPSERRFPISTDSAVVESIATLVRGHLRAGTGGQLRELAPDLVYLALMPYTGLEGARQWAESLGHLQTTGTAEYELLRTNKVD